MPSDSESTVQDTPISDDFLCGNVEAGLEKIRTRLLDLTGRNKLLNFRHPKTSCVRFVDATPDEVFEDLIEGGTLDIEPVPEPPAGKNFASSLPLKDGEVEGVSPRDHALSLGWNIDFDLQGSKLSPRLRTLAYPDDLERLSKKIATAARTSVEESGANMLYLCFGFLEWFDTPTSPASHAPLLIMPVAMERERTARGTGWVYQLQYSGEDLATNLSLVEKMKRDFSVDIPLLSDDDTPSAYISNVANAIRGRSEWRTQNFLTLALLSFGKLLMFLDLDPKRWPTQRPIAKHPNILNLFQGTRSSGTSFPEEYAIDDEVVQPSVPPLFYDADSSQHSALIDALKGINLVIEGPPGTGKSQTITNLIASTLLQGKSVLFVAEKLAALEVVERRLNAIGLGDFCLELHSHKTRKRELLNSIERRLGVRGSANGASSLQHKLSQAAQTKVQLNRYVKLLNTPNASFGSTTFAIIWARHRAAMALPVPVEVADSLLIGDPLLLTRPAYEKGQHSVRLFKVLTEEMLSRYKSLGDHPWFGLRNVDLGYVEQNQLLASCREAIEMCKDCVTARGGLLGRGFEVEGTFGDLEICNSLQRLFPVASSVVVKELLPVLGSEAQRDKVGEHCRRIDEWRRIRSAIALFANVEIVTEAEPQHLSELSALISESDVVELTLMDISELGLKLQHLHELLRTAISLLEWANRTFSVNLAQSVSGARTLANLLQAIVVAPVSDLRIKHAALLNEGATTTIRSAQERSVYLRAKGKHLARTFELADLPTAKELRGHVAALLDSNYISRFFRDDCRTSKRAYRRLLKAPRSVPLRDMIAGFRELIEYSERLEEYSSNTRFKDVGGFSYDGIDTPWESLLRASEWLHETIFRLGPRGRELGAALITIPILQLEAVRGEIEAKRGEIEALQVVCEQSESFTAAVPQSIQEPWEGDLGTLDAWLRRTLEKLAKVAISAKTIGLADDCELFNVKALIDLQQKEVDLRCGLESTVADLGLESVYHGPETNTKAILDTIEFATAVDSAGFPCQVRDGLILAYDKTAPVVEGELAAYSDALTHAQSKLSTLAKLANLDSMKFYGLDELQGLSFELAEDRLQRAISSPDDLPMYVDWLWSEHECSTNTLPELTRFILEEKGQCGDLPLIYEYVFYNSLASASVNANPELMGFKGLAHEQVRERFAALDREIMALNAKHAAAILDSRRVPAGIRSGPVGQWTDLALIDHEITKQKRHLPIRQLVNRAGGALKALKPCFMMGPLSVAQYLEPGILQFDLVIMDEASQLKPEDALGAIARGAQLVVVGDPKQLPPTTFFERTVDDGDIPDDELTAAEDAESILDVASSVYQPVRRLRWHYRSRHHSLIEFSNHEFYKNLIIFPSAYAEHPELGVKLVDVKDGRFVNRRNVVEAQKVVNAAIEHMRLHPHESLGVVALNFEQRELIDDLLDNAMVSDPYAELFISGWKERSEPLFVKNLENVQGDERDVIFISTTYGPNESGQQFQRFGPINGAQGHRRLNVLFTRAKRRIQVFSSLDPTSISSDGVSWGVKVLRQYLQFAKTGSIPELAGSGGDADSDFETAVGDLLRSAGYDVVPQVGVAGFFIDIGVKDPAQPGRFLAGVECDGAAYHSAKSARDRDRLRQQILETHGWKIYRVWSTDWFKNRKHEQARLLQFLSATKTASAKQSGSTLPLA